MSRSKGGNVVHGAGLSSAVLFLGLLTGCAEQTPEELARAQERYNVCLGDIAVFNSGGDRLSVIGAPFVDAATGKQLFAGSNILGEPLRTAEVDDVKWYDLQGNPIDAPKTCGPIVATHLLKIGEEALIQEHVPKDSNDAALSAAAAAVGAEIMAEYPELATSPVPTTPAS